MQRSSRSSPPSRRPSTPAVALAALALLLVTGPSCARPEASSGSAGEAPESRADAPEPAEPTPAKRRIAVTIDDLPVTPDRHTFEQQERITEKLLAVLAEHEVPALGLVNEKKLEGEAGEVDPRRVALLERWLDAGHELGNHGYGHLDLHTVDPDEWLADVLRGERVTRPLVEGRGEPFRFFRHPFLHTGRTVEIQERTEAFLGEHGYTIAPVTIDNGEWIYGGAYADAWNRGDEAAMERLGEDYVRYMLEVVGFYERQTEAILSPEEAEAFPHALLIHAYALNADWLDPLLDALEERGYEWIPLEEALEHPAYDRPVHGYTGQGGITWLHRWAITEGVDRSIFRGEPEVPAWVEEMRNGPAAGDDAGADRVGRTGAPSSAAEGLAGLSRQPREPEALGELESAPAE